MSPDDDFALFKTDDGNGAEPTDGAHTATLVRAVINYDKDDGRAKWVILEWQTTDLAYYWTSFHGVTGQAKHFTKQTLSGLGIDLEQLTGWDQVGEELAAVEDKVFAVKVARNGKYLNTSVEGTPEHVQTELPVQAPSTTPAPASAVFDDSDVPF